jgi:uncharacterized protein (DUF2147 family)
MLPLIAMAAVLAEEGSLEGRWRSPGGNSIIDIAACGTELCGTIAWASDKAKQDARKATDQLIGTQIFTQLEEKKPGRWQGRLYIPDKNMRVTAKIQLTSPQQLKVSGCVVICKSETWSRFDDPLPE